MISHGYVISLRSVKEVYVKYIQFTSEETELIPIHGVLVSLIY